MIVTEQKKEWDISNNKSKSLFEALTLSSLGGCISRYQQLEMTNTTFSRLTCNSIYTLYIKITSAITYNDKNQISDLAQGLRKNDQTKHQEQKGNAALKTPTLTGSCCEWRKNKSQVDDTRREATDALCDRKLGMVTEGHQQKQCKGFNGRSLGLRPVKQWR